MPMRRLIVGDIHARYEALRTVLEMASFDPDEDILYSTGDLCDRGREPVETLEFLSSLPGFRPVLGNHDIWLELFLLTGEVDVDWLYNGGVDTIRRLSSGLSKRRMEELGRWLSSFPVIRLEEDDIIMHGGPGPCRSMAEVERLAALRRPSPFRIGNADERSLFGILWDRDYLFSAMESERYEVPSKYMKVHYDLVPPLETERTIWSGHTQLIGTARPFIAPSYHLSRLHTIWSQSTPELEADWESSRSWTWIHVRCGKAALNSMWHRNWIQSEFHVS